MTLLEDDDDDDDSQEDSQEDDDDDPMKQHIQRVCTLQFQCNNTYRILHSWTTHTFAFTSSWTFLNVDLQTVHNIRLRSLT